MAIDAAVKDVESGRTLALPEHLRDASYRGAKRLGHGEGYQYAHDLEEKVADMDCLPDNLRGRQYYHPTAEGREKALAQRLEEIRRLRQQSGKTRPTTKRTQKTEN